MDEIGGHTGVPQIEPPRNRATLSAGTRLPAAALTSVNLEDQMRQTVVNAVGYPDRAARFSVVAVCVA
jgi:hypothetical protein